MNEREFNSCVKRILEGDKSGLREIYDVYLPYIYQIVLGVVGRKEDAEDITSDFFIKFWQQADKYKPGSGHKGYLATMARNMAIDASNVMYVHKGKTTRVGFKIENDKKVRFAKATGEVID